MAFSYLLSIVFSLECTKMYFLKYIFMVCLFYFLWHLQNLLLSPNKILSMEKIFSLLVTHICALHTHTHIYISTYMYLNKYLFQYSFKNVFILYISFILWENHFLRNNIVCASYVLRLIFSVIWISIHKEDNI